MVREFLARQFARPWGLVGRYVIAPWLDRISRAMNAFALAALDAKGGERVLEVGFGGGALLRALGERGVEAVGVDVSEAAVARARARGLTVSRASVEALPFADSAFDATVSLNSLYFWPEPERAFAELARVVRPGGRLLVLFEPTEELRKWPGHSHGFRLYEVAEVKGLIEQAGFGGLEESWGRGRKPDLFCCLSARRLGANG